MFSFVSAFSHFFDWIYSLDFGEGLEGYNFPTDKKQERTWKWGVVGRIVVFFLFCFFECCVLSQPFCFLLSPSSKDSQCLFDFCH